MWPEASCGSSDEVSIGSDSVEIVSNDDAFVTRRFTPDQCAEDDEVCLPSTCAVAGDDLLLPLMSMNLTSAAATAVGRDDGVTTGCDMSSFA